jgi:hypothetical protein
MENFPAQSLVSPSSSLVAKSVLKARDPLEMRNAAGFNKFYCLIVAISNVSYLIDFKMMGIRINLKPFYNAY